MIGSVVGNADFRTHLSFNSFGFIVTLACSNKNYPD